MPKNNIAEQSHPELNTVRLINQILSDAQYQQATENNYVPTPHMIWGQPGVGKSQIIRRVGKLTGRPVIDIRLLLKDPTDLSGIPYYDPQDNVMRYAKPADFPDPNGYFANAIILLDELSSAPEMVQAAALQLVLERKIGEYELPEGVMILAAGNRSTDGTAHSRMPTPLRNRFAHWTLIVDSAAWIDWAAQNEIVPSVVAFIKENPSELNKFDPKDRQRYAFATPRSWEFVSREINKVHALRKMNFQIPDEQLFSKINALVGVDVGAKFRSHYKSSINIPEPHKIINGEIKEYNIKETHLKFQCTLNIQYTLRQIVKSKKNEGYTENDKEVKEMIDNALFFVLNNINDKDLVISFMWFFVDSDKEDRIDITNSDAIMEIVEDPDYNKFLQAFM